MATYSGGRLPTHDQQLILQATLTPGETSRQAAIAWLASIDLNQLDGASSLLLPLLHQRLAADSPDLPLLPILRGIRKRTWYRNRMLFPLAAQAIAALQQAAIPCLLLKGAALTVTAYRDISLRPMMDVDILVPWHHGPAALQLLLAAGWSLEDPRSTRPDYLSFARQFQHGVGLRHPSGHGLDLHWNMLTFNLGPAIDDSIFTAARTVDFEGISYPVPDPADLLLHICVHGFAWDRLAPIRWIPDSILLLRAHPDLNWARLLAATRARNLAAIVLPTLDYLESLFPGTVPPHVLTHLRAQPAGLLARFEYRQLLHPTDGLLGTMRRAPAKFLRSTASLNPLRRTLLFPHFLCWLWEVNRPSQLPAALYHRFLRKLRSRTPRP